MKNEQNDITDELLVKYLLGEATEAEIAQIQLWINSSTDNKKHYTDLGLVWNKSKGMVAISIVNTDEAWHKFQKRTQARTIPITSNKQYKWLKVAALAILFIGAGTTLFLTRQNSSIVQKTTNSPTNIVKTETSDNNYQSIKNEQLNEKIEKSPAVEKKQIAAIKAPKNKRKINEYKKSIASNISQKSKKEISPNITKGIICNGTPQPIEICITQTIKCNGQPSTISTCSTLEPDQSGRLHYKTHDKIGKHCTMSIDEITIKTISTGETIVLNANSKPSTAQDFFKYITGQKKGGIVAGVFHNDCDDNENCGLRFDNNFGDLILQ